MSNANTVRPEFLAALLDEQRSILRKTCLQRLGGGGGGNDGRTGHRWATTVGQRSNNVRRSGARRRA